MDVRRSRYGDRVFFHADTHVLISVPIGWTSLAEPDPFVIIADGTAHFRLDDLHRLADIIDDLKRQETSVEELDEV